MSRATCEYETPTGKFIDVEISGWGKGMTAKSAEYVVCGQPATHWVEFEGISGFWTCAFHYDECMGDHGEGSFKYPEAAILRNVANRNDNDCKEWEVADEKGNGNDEHQ